MMKAILTALTILLAAQTAQARLGETRDQSEARYGLPKSERPPKGQPPLLEGAREVTFHYQGFKIRCAFLTATDGQEYVVREEYSRLLGQPAIKDLERDAILEGEKNGQSWTLKTLDPIAEQDFRKPAAGRVETKMTSMMGGRAGAAGILEEPKPVTAAPAQAAAKPVQPARSPASPFILGGAQFSWARSDGATASHGYHGYPVRLDLPQAAKYEAEMLAAKMQKERAVIPNF